jgi:hypothetical protein
MATLQLTPDEVLAGLETAWMDVSTVLQMPEGQIDYYLVARSQLAATCRVPEADGCELDRAVYTTLAADQHELNHAFMELRTSHDPPRLLVEGIADAIGCQDRGTTRRFDDVPDWRAIIDGTSDDVYGPGREFCRYLILTFGADRFLEYFEQAPDTRSPALFASNFASYWGTDIDTVWAAMQVAQPEWGPSEVNPICPCSLAAWTATAEPTTIANEPAHPYWTWPELADDTAVWAGYAGSVGIRDCAQQDLSLFSASAVTFARLDGALFTRVSQGTVARGRYVSETCSDAEVYTLPTDIIGLNSSSPMAIAVSTTPGTPVSVYLALDAPVPMSVTSYAGMGTVAVCPTCDPSGCQPLPSQPATMPVTGRFYLRWDAPASAWPYAYKYLAFSVS